ncbi:MAG: hypothetical protein DRO88_13215 [Promethearchaeia archaeon]|nr:MAG: hypothetical protein DRO88_13215 [Candidatus Lokiarchaeia archaeon]
MSQNQDFQPLTPQLGIAGSSYQLQMGKVNNFWAIRLVKGSTVLASKVYKDSGDEIPLGNHLTGWALSVIAIPNINPYQIQKTIGFIRQKALRAIEDQKHAKKTAGKAESQSVTLDKVPDNVQIKRPQVSGWVKEDEKPSQGKVAASELSPALAASNSSATGRTEGSASYRGKNLKQIPAGEGFIPTPKKSEVKTTGQASVSSTQLQEILKRLNSLEHIVNDLEADNIELRKELQSLKAAINSKK